MPTTLPPEPRDPRRIFPRPLLIVSLAVALLAAGAAVGWALNSGDSDRVVREALAQKVNPTGGKGRTLGLTRVTVKPGAELALHHHPGTQISYIDSGTLTYTVVDGSAKVMTGPADDHPKLVRRIDAGDTAKIKPGQWLIEQPSDRHMAANNGDEPVVIYLSTLFPKGASPSIAG